MRTVKIRLRHADLSREMEAMREWLDQSGYAPSRFNCERDGIRVVISVDFLVDAHAEAFAARFPQSLP